MTRSPSHTESLKRANSRSTSVHLFAAFLLVVVLFVPSQLCSTLPDFNYQPCPLAEQLSNRLAQFKKNEICDTVNLAGTVRLNSNYSHCRVINGFVSIRHWKLGPSTNNSELNVQFPNLEIITQFLLLYNINSVKDTVSLNTIFPKLHLIAGEQRFLNHSVYISKFFADDKIELNSLAEVCGPVWIQHSPLVCFRHSNLYWRLVPQVNNKEHFDRTFVDLNITENLLKEFVDKDHIDARLSIRYEMPADKRSELSNFSSVRFSIFDIDPTMYRFITGEEQHPPNCTQLDRIEIVFEFADLVNSDHLNTFLVDHMKWHLESMVPLGRLNLSAHCITKPPTKLKELQPQFAIVNAHYDIRRIYHALVSNPQYDVAVMKELYEFKFDHLYIIKVLLCFGPTLHECSISQFRKLHLKKSMFGANGTLKPERFKKDAPPITPTRKANNLSEKSTPFFKMHFTTLAIALGILLFFLLTIVVVPHVKQCFSMPSWFSKAEVVSSNPDYTAISSIWSCDQMSESELSTEDTSYEIERLNVKILYHKLLGKGEFGNVYEGLLFPNAANIPDNYGGGDTGAIRVAIKMLRENTKEMDRERFVTEAGLMRAFNSNFLVKLIGVCTLQEPILVVMEYMEHGDLKRYLRQKFQSYSDQPSFATMPTFETSVRMAIQIADGMFYLHTKRIIHRDLAARNCMVAADFTVKIGDFGMTRGIYLTDYYRMSDQALMPLRWMAPESVRKMVFTQQTDVWSYGVVLWEIMTFGEQPYRGKTDQEVKGMLVDCVRLSRPAYHTPVIWEVAKSCWHKNPNNRPTFFTIIEKLYCVLGKLQEEFRNKSHFHSCGTMHRRSLGFAVWNFISEHCLDLIGKFSHQHGEHDTDQTDYTRQPFLQHQQSSCQPIPTLCFPGAGALCRTLLPPSTSTCLSANSSTVLCPAAFNRHGQCRSSVRSSSTTSTTTTANGQLFRPRCSSFDSSQSTNISETPTTLTMISSISQCEPSMVSRHNSAGSNNSATSTLSEQAPLI